MTAITFAGSYMVGRFLGGLLNHLVVGRLVAGYNVSRIFDTLCHVFFLPRVASRIPRFSVKTERPLYG